MNDEFKSRATTYISGLSWEQLFYLTGCIADRRKEIIWERLRKGEMPWANDEEMQLCKSGKRIEAIKAYRHRTRDPEKEWPFGFYMLQECLTAVDASWRVYEVSGFVLDYLKESGPGTKVTFFNILDAHSDSFEQVNPRGFCYEELRDALDLLRGKNLINEEVPEGDETRTTDIWLV